MARDKKAKAFTLVELMVTMAIIAILMGLAAFGIATALRVLRDNQRRDAVRNIEIALNSHYIDNSEYPADIAFAADQVTVSAGNVVPLDGITQAGGATDSGSTAYCYLITSTGYKVGALLESGEFYTHGTSPTEPPCAAGDIHAVTP